MMKNTLLLLLSFISAVTFSQEVKTSFQPNTKGKMYLYYGWNRGWYSNSDIHFKGSDYNFTLKDVEATDRPTPFSFNKYLNPANISIPQTNFRLGYFLTDNWVISIGYDHLKYVVKSFQTVGIEGEIGSAYGQHSGTYTNGDTKLIEPTFLNFEHTDGLNYVNTEFIRFQNLNPLLKINTDKVQIGALAGVGAGILYPRTDSELLGKENTDKFHVSGYGMSAKVGVKLTLWKYFFLQSEFKGGYINLTDIKSTIDDSDKASQDFFFAESMFLAWGFNFQLF